MTATSSEPGMAGHEEARRDEAPRLARLAGSAPRPTDPPARPIRVVHCLHGFGLGGTELNAVRTLERIDRERFDVRLVTLGEHGPLRARFEAAGIPIHAVPLPNMYGATAARQAWRLVRFFREWQPDVVHSHDRYTNIFGTLCARLAGVPFVITSRRWWDAMPRPGYGLANRWAYRRSDRIIANTEAVADLVRRTEGVPAERVLVVPNFLDDDAFAPLPPGDRERRLREFGIPAGALVVGIVAKLRPEKDIESLIAAVAMLAPDFPALHLLVIGDGPCEGALAAASAAAGVAERVHLAGYQPNRPNPHLLFDVSVLCSLHEGSPNSIIEAMAAARPVVGTRVGGIPDVVREGATGLLVPPAAPRALADALALLLGDAGRRAAFGRAGHAHVLDRHHERGVLPLLERLYETGPRRSRH